MSWKSPLKLNLPKNRPLLLDDLDPPLGTAQSWGCAWKTPTMKMMWHVTVGCSTLEPLPKGMHDRRVSSAESEAQQDWPSKPTEGSVVTQSPIRAWIRRRGSPAPVHVGICRPAPPACSRSDRDNELKPVQITEERCHVLGSTGSVDQPSRRVEHGPQSVYQPIRDAGECGIAVVKASQHQWHDERHKDWPRNRRTNAAESPQHRETAGHHHGVERN